MGSENPEKIVKQAAQVLELLEFFADFGRPATLADVSRSLGWPRSSTYNLLMTLARLGYLYEPTPKNGFFPSTRWASMVEKIRLAQPASESMQTMLDHLAAKTGETAVIGVVSGTTALFHQVAESANYVRFTAAEGQTVPLYATVIGRALLSQMTKAQRDNVLQKTTFTQFTPKTLISRQAIERDIETSLERGWFEGSEGFSSNLSGVAIPLPLPPYSYAVLVSGPTERMKDRMSEIAETMLDAAKSFMGVSSQLSDQ